MRHKNEELLPYYNKLKDSLEYDKLTGILYRWLKTKRIKKAVGTLTKNNYINIGCCINGKQRNVLAHRLIWYICHGELPNNQIDHIDGNRLNNKIKNLRECTHQQNLMNRGIFAENKSGYKGVYWNKTANKWHAQIEKDGVNNYLGLFTCPIKASEAYQEKATQLFGEFRRK